MLLSGPSGHYVVSQDEIRTKLCINAQFAPMMIGMLGMFDNPILGYFC